MSETTLLTWLDSLGVGALAVDSDLRVHTANAQALQTLEETVGLKIDAGVLDSADDLLLDNIRNASSPGVTDGKPSVRLTSQIGEIYEVDALHLGPLRAALSAASDAVTILTFVKSAHTWTVSLLRKRFGLTLKQANVALALYQGASISEIASESGRSRETVRTHLQRVFQKLGVRRQSELVNLLARTDVKQPTR